MSDYEGVWILMMLKIITRIAAGIAAIGIAALPLAIAAPADAINKHEGGGGTIAQPGDEGRELDPAQLAAGALGGITLTGAALAATTRLRRQRDSAPRPV